MSHRQWHDGEMVVVVLVMYVVEMLEERLQEHQDDYRDEFDQLHYREMTRAAVEEVEVDWMEELEYVDCRSHWHGIGHEMMKILVDDGTEVIEVVLVEEHAANRRDLRQVHET